MGESVEEHEFRAEVYSKIVRAIQVVLIEVNVIPFKEREMSLVVTKLEEALMWAQRGESLHGPEVEF